MTRRAFTLLLVLAATVVLPVGPAAAAGCFPAGGRTIPNVDPQPGEHDVIFHGGGWGHNLGMSQYGANGAAALGCTYQQILSTYYPGTALETKSMPNVLRVGILDLSHQGSGGAEVQVTSTAMASKGARAIQWRLCESRGCSSTNAKAKLHHAEGDTWTVRSLSDGSYEVRGLDSKSQVVKGDAPTSDGNGGYTWRGGDQTDYLEIHHEGAVIEVRPRVGGASINTRSVRWGRTELDSYASGGGKLFVNQLLTPGPDASGSGSYSAMERYLWGLGEVPSSFEGHAQRAQAVAARSYAFKRSTTEKSTCRCHVVTTPADQNYTGWAREESYGNDVWKSHVNATAAQVLMASESTVADAFYSSSFGGHSESYAYVWGGTPPSYIRAVDDSRWDLATDSTAWKNKRRVWAVGFSWETLAAKFGFDRLDDISVDSRRGSAERDRGVHLVGRKNGSVSERWLDGWTVRQTLGLLSPGFDIEVVDHLAQGGTPIAGDWDGDGGDEIGWYRDGEVALRMSDRSVRRYRYGRSGDLPIVADFDGDGIDTVSIVRDREWHINNSHTGGSAGKVFIYGRTTQGDIPLTGDWDGDGIDTVGIVRDGEWHLRNDVSGGPGQIVFVYGRVRTGDIPVTGDWNGNGRDTIGIVRGVEWHLRFELAGGAADRVFDYGNASKGDIPVTGDWDATGGDTTGIVRGDEWHLRNDLKGGAAHGTVRFAG